MRQLEEILEWKRNNFLRCKHRWLNQKYQKSSIELQHLSKRHKLPKSKTTLKYPKKNKKRYLLARKQKNQKRNRSRPNKKKNNSRNTKRNLYLLNLIMSLQSKSINLKLNQRNQSSIEVPWSINLIQWTQRSY